MNKQDQRTNEILMGDAWLAARQAMARANRLFEDPGTPHLGVQGAGELTEHIIGILNTIVTQVSFVRESLKYANGGGTDDDIPF